MTFRNHLGCSIAILALTAFGTGCSTCNLTSKDVGTLEVSQRPLSLSEVLSEKEKGEADGWAEYAKGMLLSENPEQAHAHFLKALVLLPDSQKALNAAISPLIAKKEFDKALDELEPIAKANPKSLQVNILYAIVLKELKRLPDAIEHLEKCFAATGCREMKVANPLLAFLMEARRFEEAEDVFRRLEKHGELSRNIDMVAAQALFWHGMLNVARDAAKGESEKKNDVELPSRYTVKLCEERARASVKRLNGCKITNLQELAMAGDLYATFGLWDDMWDMLGRIKDDEILNSVPYVSMKLDAMNKRGDTEAYREYARSFIDIKGLKPAFLLKLVRCFQDMKDYDSAIILLQRQIMRRPQDMELVRWLAQLYFMNSQLPQSLQIFSAMPSRNAHDEYLLSFIWRQKGDMEKAYEAICAAEKKAEGNKEFLDRDFYFSFAIICEKCGKIDEALRRSRQAYELDKENASACNFYGYMLADYDKELPFAKDLIAKALALEPDNAAYLDSMAWACYRLKEFKPALEYIMKAFANGGMDEDTDGVIARHAAEICRENGLEEMARNYFSIADVAE